MSIVVEIGRNIKYEGDWWFKTDRGFDCVSDTLSKLDKDCFICGGTINLYNSFGNLYHGTEVTLYFPGTTESEFIV